MLINIIPFSSNLTRQVNVLKYLTLNSVKVCGVSVVVAVLRTKNQPAIADNGIASIEIDRKSLFPAWNSNYLSPFNLFASQYRTEHRIQREQEEPITLRKMQIGTHPSSGHLGTLCGVRCLSAVQGHLHRSSFTIRKARTTELSDRPTYEQHRNIGLAEQPVISRGPYNISPKTRTDANKQISLFILKT